MMARKTKIDELNIIDYFSEMNLPQSEIDKRIAMAQSVKDMYHRIFVIVKAKQAVDDEIDEDFIEDMIVDEYKGIFDMNMSFVDEHIKETAKEVANATMRHLNDEYYLSDQRAITIAVNDANSIGNYEYEESFKAKGYTRKRWDTMKDLRVRHTHVMADGKEVGINEMFDVGNCKMRFPCDSEYGTAEEIVNCRCVCLYSK